MIRPSPTRSSVALSLRSASRSASTEPTPASSTIISSRPESSRSERSQRSEKSGSRVVRLMKTNPWVAKADAMARRARFDAMDRIVARPDARSSVWCQTRGVSTHEVWLVRHGETEWSKSGRHTSVTDLPLTPVGEAVAHEVGERLAGEEFALVLTSPRLRARRTAELLGHDEAEVDEDLVEWAYGDYEGITNAQIRKTVPGWTLWTHPGRPAGRPRSR